MIKLLHEHVHEVRGICSLPYLFEQRPRPRLVLLLVGGTLEQVQSGLRVFGGYLTKTKVGVLCATLTQERKKGQG